MFTMARDATHALHYHRVIEFEILNKCFEVKSFPFFTRIDYDNCRKTYGGGGDFRICSTACWNNGLIPN